MTSITIQSALNSALLLLKSADIETAALDARLLLQAAMNIDHADIIREPERMIADEEHHTFMEYIQRRASRVPLAHIIGARDFWKDRFYVSADVLTPRPDSETLIEAMLDAVPDRTLPYTIADLGTGSGCLLISLLREYPNAMGVGVDVSEAALAIAKKNAAHLLSSGRINFLSSDWCNALQTSFDMIISNPPYIAENEISALAPEVVKHEPRLALVGGEDGLRAYCQLMPHIQKHLAQKGVAVLELGQGQAEAVTNLALNHALTVSEIRCDLAGIERAIVLTHA